VKKKILIVDDDQQMCEELLDMLQHEGFFVRAVTTGEEGLSALKSTKFDLVLLDLMLPGISGFDVLKKAKGLGEETKVLVMSGCFANSPDDKDQLKFDDNIEYLEKTEGFIDKPFNVQKLLNKVKSITAQKQ
jgi:two-component system, OmpR family, response regulator